jgi:hypothetical protein
LIYISVVVVVVFAFFTVVYFCCRCPSHVPGLSVTDYMLSLQSLSEFVSFPVQAPCALNAFRVVMAYLAVPMLFEATAAYLTHVLTLKPKFCKTLWYVMHLCVSQEAEFPVLTFSVLIFVLN